MSEYCVVVLNGAHARFFTVEPAEFPETESGPSLLEKGRLLNPEARVQERALFSDSKTGRGRSPQGRRPHGYDDHRSQRNSEFERRFVRKIAQKTRQLARAHDSSCVLIAGPARMLGCLRGELEDLADRGMQIQRLAKDMIKFTPRRIHDCFAKERVLPARRRPGPGAPRGRLSL